MQNQCLIILGLCLALSMYMVEGCINPKPLVGKVMEDCYKKFNISEDELLDFYNQPADDMRLKRFAHCHYEGIGYFENGKLTAGAVKNVVTYNAGDPEDEKALDGLVAKATELIEKANEYSDEYDKAFYFLKSTQEPRNNEEILSFFCKELSQN